MDITFLGAARTVTGSKYLLSDHNRPWLVDCGLFQGLKPLRLRNWETMPFDPASLKSVLLTHAHIDHSGYLPLLAKNGFKGPIYATPGTLELCQILLPDSGHLHEEDARRANKYQYSKHHPALPLYTLEDAQKVLKQFKAVEWGKAYRITEDVEAHWYGAGHILGASFIVCRNDSTSILFSGDLGRMQDALMYPPAGIQYADYLVIESTYGDRLHDQTDPMEVLASIINSTIKRGGSVIIPSFAVGRSQALIYMLYRLIQESRIPKLPVYLDSPMAISASEIMDRLHKDHRLSRERCQEVFGIVEYTRTPEESKKIDDNAMPKILISASGMATGGRILHHLKSYAPDHRNTLLFAGYQAAGTRGADIVAGRKEVKIHGQWVPIHAQVKELNNISAHADYEEILTWLSGMPKAPRHVFITHGEEEAAKSLKDKIQERFGWSCSVPDYRDRETL